MRTTVRNLALASVLFAVIWMPVGCCKSKIVGPFLQPPGPKDDRCPEVSVTSSTFSAFDDFSSVSNPVPGGAWKYGVMSALGGIFSAYPTLGTYYVQDSPLPLSIWQGSHYDPNVMKNENSAPITSNMDWVYHPVSTYLHLHPGADGEYTVVRFTAATSGSYSVDAAFRSLRLGGPDTTTDVHVLVNGTSVFSGAINGHYSDGEVPYQATLSLKACDTVDLAVGYGSNNDYYYDSTGLRASIQKP